MSKQIYDRDLLVWIECTIEQLKNREFESLDIDQLIDELVDLGKSEKNALRSNLMVLLAHLLKLKVQHDVPENIKESWYSSVIEHRQRVLNNLIDTPSLHSFLVEAVEKAYQDGRKIAIKQGKLARFGIKIPDEKEYPLTCPFSLEQVLDEDFYGQ